MRKKGTMRKLLTSVLVLAILGWAEAGLALIQDDQVMQCSMSAHEMQAMGDMPCCPGDEAQLPAGSQHGQCCEVGQAPERPLAFVVSPEKSKAPPLEVVTVLPAASAASAAQIFGVWRSADAPRYVKPVLDLKTDLRI